MIEYEIGDTFTYKSNRNYVKLKAIYLEGDWENCAKCYFNDKGCDDFECRRERRKDNKNVNFVQLSNDFDFISIAEKGLPKKNQFVQFCDKDNIFQGYFIGDGGDGEHFFEIISGDVYMSIKGVTHWRPIPENPNKIKEE